MPKRIEITIFVDEYPADWSMTPAMWETWVVNKLKDAGVPVEGKLTFRGIKSGVLTKIDDPKDFGATKYIWEA